jgi:DnaJ homolog subfamily C member 28
LIEEQVMDNQDDQDRKGQPPVSRRPAVTRHNYHSLIDQLVAKAEADGLMDNLPGQGQPLNLDDDALVPDEYRLGFRFLKSNGFAPPWIEARRDIDQERAQLDAWLADTNARWPHLGERARAALRVTYRRKLEDLQRMILNYNLSAPPGAAHIEGLRLADQLEKLGR